jgi:hypothetical protein
MNIGGLSNFLCLLQLENLEEMEKLLNTYDFPKLNHEDKNTQNGSITSNEFESIKKALQQRKFREDMASLLYQNF